MLGKEQQITIRTTSCFEMGCRWVLFPPAAGQLIPSYFQKRIEKSTAFFKVVLHQFGSLKTTILIHFSWKRAYFPLSPKSVKVSLALHSLREPCPRVTAGLVRLILRIMQKRYRRPSPTGQALHIWLKVCTRKRQCRSQVQPIRENTGFRLARRIGRGSPPPHA